MARRERPGRVDGGWMQLAVAGEVGPVVCSALRPYVTPQTRVRTVLRFGAMSNMDVLEMLEALDARGVSVAGVRRVAGDRIFRT
jgi:hypothetical protein